MLTSDWFASVIQVKLEGDVNILRLTPFLPLGFGLLTQIYKLCIGCLMSNVTVNISFQDQLLKEIDSVAARESRSRSELLRQAARDYVRRQKQWEDVFRLGDRLTERLKLTKRDVETEIRRVRTG